jgi:Cu(I)/Ag(I) efflux system membrane protein CusA/SilA
MGIDRLIEWSARHRGWVLAATLLLAALGWRALSTIQLDAIPDLSDTQVIVHAAWPGRSADLVEDQLTQPIVTALVGGPRVKAVRGLSTVGQTWVYVIFEDGVDLYWARSRVAETLASARGRLPDGVEPILGPDATGVGWGFQYVLIDRSGRNSTEELRSFQDWTLRYELQSLPGVAEVATVGGAERQLEVRLDPVRLQAHDIDVPRVVQAVRSANREVGGGMIEVGGREVILRGRGYARDLTAVAEAVVSVRDGRPVTVGMLGEVGWGPGMRRGVTDWNGEGEAVGAIVVVRFGENVLDVVDRVKARLAELAPSLPQGVAVEVAYDRSDLIRASIDTLRWKLIEEMLVVAAVVALFLGQAAGVVVVLLMLPLAILFSFIPMAALGIGSNLMSLGGIAIAVGAMVDAAIVLVENIYKRLEDGDGGNRTATIVAAAREVGRPLFFSLAVITVSFLPVFALEAEEGRLFHPLAWTKTLAMGWATILSVTLVPALAVLLIRGRIRAERELVLSRALIAAYRPVVTWALQRPWLILGVGLAVLLAAWPLAASLGREFMPPLREGTILYMPTTWPGISLGEVERLIQVQDRAIKAVPEVASVFGKAGRADTPTDPAPLSMLETTIVLKPQSEWREGMTWEALIAELDAAARLPGVTNAWTMPIRARLDMLTTGIRTPVGVKVLGPDIAASGRVAEAIEAVLSDVPGTLSALAERVGATSYLDIVWDRSALARHGLTVEGAGMWLESAVGGMAVDQIIDGPARYPVQVRLARHAREDPEALGRLQIRTASGAWVPLAALAELRRVEGPMELRNENGARAAWVYVDTDDDDLAGYVARAQAAVARSVELPPGVRLVWSGKFEAMLRAEARLRIVVPLTLLLVAFLLWLNFHSASRVAMVMLSLPMATTGAFGLMAILGYNLSVAAWIGVIALCGVAAETAVVMLVYLDEAVDRAKASGGALTAANFRLAVIEGAAARARPKIMTAATTILGLLPILWSSGTGADLMKRVAAPMVGGMVGSVVLTLLILPALYLWWIGRGLPDDG